MSDELKKADKDLVVGVIAGIVTIAWGMLMIVTGMDLAMNASILHKLSWLAFFGLLSFSFWKFFRVLRSEKCSS